MTRVAGVLITDDLAGVVGQALAAWLKVHRHQWNPPLGRLVVELAEVADGCRSVDFDDGLWLTLNEMAQRTGIPVRTLRHRCQTGRVQARKDGPRWLVRLPANESNEWTSTSGWPAGWR